MSGDSPRSRTVGRMRALMALGATIGVAATTSRSRGDAGAPPHPGPHDAGTSDGAGESGEDAGADADAATWNPDHRYEVVDPLPPPTRFRGCGCGSPGTED